VVDREIAIVSPLLPIGDGQAAVTGGSLALLRNRETSPSRLLSNPLPEKVRSSQQMSSGGGCLRLTDGQAFAAPWLFGEFS
jgi:hypothetical protein